MSQLLLSEFVNLVQNLVRQDNQTRGFSLFIAYIICRTHVNHVNDSQHTQPCYQGQREAPSWIGKV